MELTRKKRRGWVIVAFVLVLVSLGTWWQWPRGDARFVGKWLLLPAEENRSMGTLVLSANGTGSFTTSLDPFSKVFSWTSSGHRLQIGRELPQWMMSLHPKMIGTTRTVFGTTVILADETFLLEPAPDGRWRMEHCSGRAWIPTGLTMKRIPE